VRQLLSALKNSSLVALANLYFANFRLGNRVADHRKTNSSNSANLLPQVDFNLPLRLGNNPRALTCLSAGGAVILIKY
jgi:hypothetical protein